MNLQTYVDKGINFKSYEADIQKVIDSDRNEALDMYYALNLKRMRRLQLKIELNQAQREKLEKLTKNITLLVITEGWCGDAAQIIPMIQLIVDASDKIQEKIVYRDHNPELINEYLTNGAQSIPIIVGVDDQGEPLFRWGPRPAFGTILLKKYKDGEMSKDDFAISLQKEYNKDKGQSIINELIDKISHA
ncbi:MAG: thioredoxin family protein [Weeksellaceae bacterium]